MRALIVNTNVCKMGTDGISSVILNLFRSMDKTQMTMDVVVTVEPDQIYCDEMASHNSKLIYIPKSKKRLFAYVLMLSKVIKQGEYDLVHIHGSSNTMAVELLAAALGGCKVRLAHSHNTTCKYMTIHRLLKPLFSMLCTHRLACGEAAGHWLFPGKDFCIVNNGVNTDRFRFLKADREEYRCKHGFTEKNVVIGHVGNFWEQKNHEFLIDAFASAYEKNQELRLLLIGQGKMKETMQQRCKELHIDDVVIFAGLTDNMPAYLSAMDTFALPSLFEGLPLTLIEAQASGLSCIVSDRVTKEVDKTGLLRFLSIDNGEENWVQHMVQLELLSGEQREASSLQAIEKIKKSKYDIIDEAERLRSYYSDAIRR